MKSYKKMQASHQEMDKELYDAIGDFGTIKEVLDYLKDNMSLNLSNDGVLSLEITDEE